jgi:hypothetical protein
MRLINLSTSTGATALHLQTDSSKPPMTVNSGTKVDNLNSDMLDGQDSSAFAPKSSEAWHEVGASGEPAFAQPFGINGWANYGDGYNTVGFYKDSVGNVHLKGLFMWTPTTSLGYLPCDGPPVFTLPPGYRPQAKELQGTHKKPADAGRIDILPSGEVRACDSNVNQGKWFSLDGINFRAAQ